MNKAKTNYADVFARATSYLVHEVRQMIWQNLEPVPSTMISDIVKGLYYISIGKRNRRILELILVKINCVWFIPAKQINYHDLEGWIYAETSCVPSAESSRSVRGLGKGVSGKPYPRLCNARRPRLEPRTFRSQAVRLYRLHQARPSRWNFLH